MNPETKKALTAAWVFPALLILHVVLIASLLALISVLSVIVCVFFPAMIAFECVCDEIERLNKKL